MRKVTCISLFFFVPYALIKKLVLQDNWMFWNRTDVIRIEIEDNKTDTTAYSRVEQSSTKKRLEKHKTY